MKNKHILSGVIDIMVIGDTQLPPVGDINIGGFCGDSHTGGITGARHGGGFCGDMHSGGFVGDTAIPN